MVSKSALRTRAASTNRSEVIANFPQKSRFSGVFRRCFSRLSPHPGQFGKSHLLSILIIYRYIHACQVSGKSYGNFLRSRLKCIKTVYIWTGTGRRLGVGPYPLLECQNPLKKRRPPRRARLNRETRGRWGSWKIRVVLSSDNEVIFTFGFQKTHHFFSFQSSSSVSKHLLTALVALQNVLRMLCSQCVCHRRQNDA